MVEKDRLDINKWKKESLDFTNEAKGFVEGILDVQPCPNCGWDLLNWKCENYKSCWYWHWDDYLKCKDDQRLINSIDMLWSWEKFKLATLRWQEFYYYNYFWRIKENSAMLELNIKWKKYVVNLFFTIVENDDIKTIWSITINWDIIQKVKWKEDKKVFFRYDEMKKYAIIVLNDRRFNNFIISK